ncbi:DUF3467 domain-containing protein [Candidatus Woesearchaeota archaeon]|nr:DUF3467 domain-containing protein [Candidatus Woesearchaeota archaeon]
MEQKNMNISVNEGAAFYCHELSVNYNPLQFTIDFKEITPRVDPRSKQGPIMNIRHNVVMLDPWHAKQMLGLLNKVVSDFERDFGEIKRPKVLDMMEKKMKKKGDAKKDEKTTTAPSYFG